MGPYRTPLALGREPWTAAFFGLCAPLMFPIFALALVQSMAGDELSLAASWTTACVAAALQFAVVSVWSQRIGAGPFAGAMDAPQHWLLIGLAVGPILLFAPFVTIDMFMPEGAQWAYRDGVDLDAFSRANWTMSFILYGVLVAPVVEEVTYRGVVMGAIMARGGSPAAAAVLSSMAFALPHMQYSGLGIAAVFVSGLGLAALRVFSGTIIVPIVAHMAANGMSFILSQ